MYVYIYICITHIITGAMTHHEGPLLPTIRNTGTHIYKYSESMTSWTRLANPWTCRARSDFCLWSQIPGGCDGWVWTNENLVSVKATMVGGLTWQKPTQNKWWFVSHHNEGLNPMNKGENEVFNYVVWGFQSNLLGNLFEGYTLKRPEWWLKPSGWIDPWPYGE